MSKITPHLSGPPSVGARATLREQAIASTLTPGLADLDGPAGEGQWPPVSSRRSEGSRTPSPPPPPEVNSRGTGRAHERPPTPSGLEAVGVLTHPVDLKALAEELTAASRSDLPGYARVKACALDFAARYERGEISMISTDEARIYTPHLEDVSEAEIPALLQTSHFFARAVAREAMSILLEKFPDAPAVYFFGPAGAGKSTTLRNLQSLSHAAPDLYATLNTPHVLRFETLAFRKQEFLDKTWPASMTNNPLREVATVQVIADPARCGERVVHRFLQAKERKDLLMMLKDILGGYEAARKSATEMEAVCAGCTPAPKVYVFDTNEAVPRRTSADALEPMEDDFQRALSAAKKVVRDVVKANDGGANAAHGWRLDYLSKAIAAIDNP